MKRLGLPPRDRRRPSSAGSTTGAGGRHHPRSPRRGRSAIGTRRARSSRQGEPSGCGICSTRYPWLRFLPFVMLLVLGLTRAAVRPATRRRSGDRRGRAARAGCSRLLTKWSKTAAARGLDRRGTATPARSPPADGVELRDHAAGHASSCRSRGRRTPPRPSRSRQALRDVYTFTQVTVRGCTAPDARPARPHAHGGHVAAPAADHPAAHAAMIHCRRGSSARWSSSRRSRR